MKIIYWLFLIIFVCLFQSGCGQFRYSPEYSKLALIENQDQRSILSKQINSVTLIVNTTPDMQLGIPHIFKIEELVANVRKQIEDNKIKVTEIIFTDKPIKLPYVKTPIEAQYLSNPSLFEQFYNKNSNSDAAYLILLDSSDLRDTMLTENNIYVSFSVCLLMNNKRVSVSNYSFNWESVKTQLTLSSFIMPIFLIERLNASHANAYSYIFEKKISFLVELNSSGIFSSVNDFKRK